MRRGLILIGVIAALLSAVRHFPLVWAMGAAPAGLGTPSGTIWNGQLADVPLFDRLSVKAGLGHVTVETPPAPTSFTTQLSPGQVKDLALSLPFAAMPIQDQRLQGVRGRVSLRIDQARFSDLQCEMADGTAATNVLAMNAQTLGWSGPDLSGPVDCVEGQVRVRLTGADSAAEVDATVLIGADGVYQTDILARVSQPGAGAVLGMFGFSSVSANEFRLSEQGRWR